MTVHPHVEPKVEHDPEPSPADVVEWRRWRIRDLKRNRAANGFNASVSETGAKCYHCIEGLAELQTIPHPGGPDQSWEVTQWGERIFVPSHNEVAEEYLSKNCARADSLLSIRKQHIPALIQQLEQDRFDLKQQSEDQHNREQQKAANREIDLLHGQLTDKHRALGSVSEGERRHCKIFEAQIAAVHRIQGEIRIIESRLRALGA